MPFLTMSGATSHEAIHGPCCDGDPQRRTTFFNDRRWRVVRNAAIVVLFQIPITRWVSKYRSLVVMVVGTLLYVIGFGMYGFISTYVLFLVAMVIITVGEMLVTPVGQAIAARLSPEETRGRYMALFGFSWVIPTAVGPFLAGLVMDNIDPGWVWYGAGIMALIAAGAYYLLLAGQKTEVRLRLGSDSAT